MSLRKSLALLLALALAVCLAPRSRAQEKKAEETKPAARSAVPAKSADAFYLVINDPLPQLKTLLNSESLHKVLTEGAIGELVGMIPFAPALDLRVAWGFIDENRRYVPAEIAIGFSQESVAQLDRLARAGLFAGLCYGAHESDDDAAKKDRAKLQDELLRELKELGLPPMTVLVRLREEEDAETFFDFAKERAKAASDLPGYEVIEIDDGAGIGLRGTLGEQVPEFLLDMAFEHLGIDEAKRPEFRKAIAGLKMETWVQRTGSSLRMTVGPRPDTKAAPFTTAQLGPLFRLEERDILFARWDATKLKTAVKGWADLWKKWEDTPAGKQLAKLDEEKVIGDLIGSKRSVERMANTGSTRIWSDDDALRGVERSEGAPPSADLRTAAISRYVPKGTEAYSLDSTVSLADTLSAYLEQMEGRLSLQSLRAQFGGDELRGRIAEELSTNYYKHFAEFRKNILERLPEAVSSPSASMFTTTGKVERFTFGVTIDGERKKYELKDLPIFQRAAVGRAKDAKRAEEVVAATYRSFVQGIYGAAGKTLPEDAKLVVERDLGLGVKTHVFAGEWIKAVSGDFEVEMSVEGDFVPHYFLHDGHVVFSTSPKLSKRMLAATKESGGILPPTKTGYERTVAYGVLPGRTLGNIFSHLASWVGAGVKEAGGDAAVVALAPIEKVGKGISELFELIDRIEWAASEKTGVLESEFAVRWSRK